jgi:hypothetical protein
LRRYPFDRQSLKAIFQVLGFDRSEVVLDLDPEAGSAVRSEISLPQWIIAGITISPQDRPTLVAGHRRVASGFVTTVNVKRESFYISRLVTLPLVVIVLLSFSVFWIGPSALVDRISISFIGILTAVAYQLLMSETLPRIAYVTWINAFLSVSFLMMVGTVVVDLVVGTLDRRGGSALALRIDHLCRWIFPIAYFGLILSAFVVTFLIL